MISLLKMMGLDMTMVVGDTMRILWQKTEMVPVRISKF